MVKLMDDPGILGIPGKVLPRWGAKHGQTDQRPIFRGQFLEFHGNFNCIIVYPHPRGSGIRSHIIQQVSFTSLPPQLEVCPVSLSFPTL